MARPFSARDAKNLTRKHKELQKLFADAGNLDRFCRDEISNAVRVYVQKGCLELLKDIPVEELNRDKQGIRVKALRERGYTTMADIAKASAMQIKSIRGIGEETAALIRTNEEKIMAETAKTVSIRLSADDKNQVASQLVCAIDKFRQAKPCIEKSANMQELYGKRTAEALSALACGTGRLKWLFSSKASKEKAQAAFRFLTELQGSEYEEAAEQVKNAQATVKRVRTPSAWESFQKSPIDFYNILEEVAPGVVGGKDAVFGLPEELAGELEKESFSLEGLSCQLRRYQEWGVRYILHQKSVLLGDEMGLGKTVQAIAAMVAVRNAGATHFMVVCPASVLSNWCREIQKHSDLTVTKIYGSEKERNRAIGTWLSQGGVAVTNYETTDNISLPQGFSFSMMVVDEAHYIKNPTAMRTVCTKKLSEHTQRLLFMTGTALENRVDEMITLLGLLQPTVADSVKNMKFLSSAPKFREKIAPVYYRRKRDDVLTELPELMEVTQWCTLMPEEEAVYEQAILSKNYPLARRVSWNVSELEKSSKAKRMLEIVEEAEADGRKVLVFSFFLDTIRKVCTLLGNRCMEPIMGSVPPVRRQEIIDQFDKAPAGSVLVAQIQSGGTGLNIQSASVVILCEPQFKPSTENQAIARAYRMGQSRNVLAYRLICEDSIDERITEILAEKQRVFDAFADESEAAKEALELDEKSFANLMDGEAERIRAKAQREG